MLPDDATFCSVYCKSDNAELTVLNERRFRKHTELPSPEDLQILNSHLIKSVKQFDLQKPDSKTYRRVTEVALTRLGCYNKRRSGEVEAISLKNYMDRRTELSDVDESIVGDLSDVENYLLRSQDLMVVRGKMGRGVPVIIPPDLIKPLEYLANPVVRGNAAILEENKYLFPNSVLGSARAYDCLTKLRAECTLKSPERLTSVSLRKYTSTITQVECRGATLLTLEVARLLGLDDTNKATEHDRELLRLLSSISKLYTGKQAMSVVSEGLESIGGLGYMEDTGLPQILRDAQVLTIWEGTTNILSLDVLRAVGKTKGGVLRTLHADIQRKLKDGEKRQQLSEACSKISAASSEILQFAASTDPGTLEVAARDFAYGIARTFIGALLVEHAGWEDASSSDIVAAQRWCEKDLSPFLVQNAAKHYSQSSCGSNYDLVFDGYMEKSRL